MTIRYDPRASWPPMYLSDATAAITEWSAWYEGDPRALGRFYGAVRRKTTRVLGGFWERTHEDLVPAARQRLHLPLAADIARTSSDLLFGEPLALRVPTGTDAQQEALDALVDRTSLLMRLHEAAERCSALGGVWLRGAWDTEAAEHPIVTSVDVDKAVPEARYGIPSAVTFWTELIDPELSSLKPTGRILRHLERHEPGRILHSLYEGTELALGHPVPLDTHPNTADLAPGPGDTRPDDDPDAPLGSIVQTGLPALACVYVPNLLPSRRLRNSPGGHWYGRPDAEGLEGAFDALDEWWTSLARDVRIGKGRVAVPREFLRTLDPENPQTGGRGFDLDQEVFTPLDMGPDSADKNPISSIQFDIRAEDHLRAIEDLTRTTVDRAGYSPATFGFDSRGGAESGVSRKVRERKSVVTTAAKQRYWGPAVRQLVGLLVLVDQEQFGQPSPLGTTGALPLLGWADPFAADLPTRAATVDLLERAGAASTLERVRIVHPEWTEQALESEVVRIRGERTVPAFTIPGLDQGDPEDQADPDVEDEQDEGVA